MRPTMTWWRNLGGLMAACVLALLVVAPTVGMAACLCDGGAPVVGVETSAVIVSVQRDQQEHRAPCEAACCVSGHCHHGGALLDTAVAEASAPALAVAASPLTVVHALASRTISGPDRPPRA